MIEFFKARLTVVWSMLAIVIFCGVLGLSSAVERKAKERDMKAVAFLTSGMQARCVGRYLIDLPPGFSPSEFSSANFFIGLDADHDLLNIKSLRSGLSEAQFSDWTKQVVDKWNEKDEFVAPGQPDKLLAKVIPYGEERLLYTRIRLSEAVDLRYLGFRDDAAFELIREANAGAEKIALGTARLLDLAQRTTRIRDPMNSGPGACYDNLLIAGQYDEESFEFIYVNPQRPDIRVRIVFAGIQIQAEEDIFARARSFTARFGLEVPIIHSRTYPFQGMTANENGLRTPSDISNGKTNYAFQFETRRDNGSIRRPLIRVVMEIGTWENGKQIGTDLSQGEAQAVWEAVIKSLRPRPGAI